MLEIASHKYLKNFLKSNFIDWNHIYSFGRIISKCIQTDQNYLINSEIFLTDKWFSPLLISLFLNEKDIFLVISREKIEVLKKKHLNHLKEFGFNFEIINDQIIFSKHKIFLISLIDILKRYDDNNFNGKRIVLSDIANLKADLKDILKINLLKKDWFKCIKNNNHQEKVIQQQYNSLKKRFFSRAIPTNEKVYLSKSEIKHLKEFFKQNKSFSQEFSRVNDALFATWACWVKVNYENFEWSLVLEPIDELNEIRDLLTQNYFLFLSSFRKDNFFRKYLKGHNFHIDLVVNFKSDFDEKSFSIYVPPRQMLPNNPLFLNSISTQISKLFLLSKGLTLILTDTHDLKINLATNLASQYGYLVLLETLPKANKSILVASYDWWFKNQFFSILPDQIIIPVLPIPDITDPINEQTISFHFKRSKDWFREFLLPEAVTKLEKAVSPLRKNSGSLVILDGRVRNRQWGRELIKKIQPSKVLNHMFPFE